MYDSSTHTPQQIVEAMEAAATRFETPCGDGTIVWRAWGDEGAPPLVLLHGAHGSWAHWIRNIPRLALSRRVIAADLPGCGESAPPPRHDIPWAIAEPLADGLRQLPLATPVDLTGFSLGAAIGTHLAAAAPELVRRLVLVDAGGLDTPMNTVVFRRLSGLSPQERVDAQRFNLLQLMLHDEASVDDLAIHLQLTKARRGALDGQVLVLPDRLLQVLPQVRCPVDVIWGEFDQPHPDPEVQIAAIRTIKPNARLRVVPGAGHWAMYENPQAFDAHLQQLLA